MLYHSYLKAIFSWLKMYNIRPKFTPYSMLPVCHYVVFILLIQLGRFGPLLGVALLTVSLTMNRRDKI